MRNLAWLLVFVGFSAYGQMASTLTCQVIVIAEDLENIDASKTFEIPIVTETSHGGEPKEFSFGDHTVTVLADGKWLGLSWKRGQKLLAEGVTVIEKITDQSRVLILYNPDNQSEQTSVDCRK